MMTRPLQERPGRLGLLERAVRAEPGIRGRVALAPGEPREPPEPPEQAPRAAQEAEARGAQVAAVAPA